MKVAVWDTYVKREDGLLMHFDILVPNNTDESQVYNYGKRYLKNKPFTILTLNTKACNFCHIEQATQKIVDDIGADGFSIIEMEHCN